MYSPKPSVRPVSMNVLFFFFIVWDWRVGAIGPEVSVSSPEDSFINAMEGFGTDLQCFVSSCLPPGKTVKWYKDEKLIAENTGVTSNTSRLSIRHTVDIDKTKVCQGGCSSSRKCATGMFCVDNACCTCNKEEFTLVIYNLSSTDTGVYHCTLDETDFVEFQLNVLEGGLPPTFSENITFDYTACCEKNGIDKTCQSICKPQALEAQKYDPFACQKEFGKLLQCASQNGNTSHVHCCRLQLVPQFCWDFCSGSNVDFERANRLCVYWMPEIFQCYEQVYLPLPGHPEQLMVSSSNSTSIEACWQPPRIRPETVMFYTVRYQEIPHLPIFGGFGDEFEEGDYSIEELPSIPHDHGSNQPMPIGSTPPTSTTKAPGRGKRQTFVITSHSLDTNETDVREYRPEEINTTETCVTIRGLKPMTQYTVVVRAYNKQGFSLPSIRASTITADVEYTNSTFPNIRECCSRKGVEEECAVKMCDVAQPPGAFSAFNVALTCRSEFPKVAPCLADGRDHTECCRSKNVGTECLKLCNGSSTQLGASSVLCLSLDLNAIYTCLKQGYETHPSPPTNISVGKITGTSAYISWSPPKDNSEKVTGYSLFYRDEIIAGEYREIRNVTSPYELHNLMPDILHSVYVVAYTPNGKSLRSTVLFFYTAERSIDAICAYGQPLRDSYGQPVVCGSRLHCPDLFECVDSENDDDDAFYCCPTKPFVEPEHHKEPNITACCSSRGVTGKCLKLCSYETTTDDLLSNGKECAAHVRTWVECAGDGRDDRPCCEHQNVPAPCTDFCYPSPDQPTHFTAEHNSCVKFVREISKCSLEGIYSLPGPPRYLRHLIDGPTWATVRWDKPYQTIRVDYYEVHFINGSQETIMNTTGLSISLDDLILGITYSVKVRSVNTRGASVFSGNLTFTLEQEPIEPIYPEDFPTAPSEATVKWYRDGKANLTWEWIPEMVDSKTRILHYNFNVSYGQSLANGSRVNWKSVITKEYYVILENLLQNATYDVYVKAIDLDTKVTGIPGTIISFKASAAKSAPWAEIETIPDGPFDVGEKLELACVGGGDPVPNVTLEGYGRRLATGVGMASTPIQIKSVADGNEDILCTADNGHFVPFRTAYSIKVRYPPQVTPYLDPVHVIQDLSARLVCRIRAYPTAEITWYYQSESDKQQKRVPKEISPSEKYDMDFSIERLDNTFNATLTVLQAEPHNEGYYYCKGCNDVGCSNSSMKLIVEPYPVPPGPEYVLDCCKKQRIRPDCLSACTLDIDIRVYETNLHCVDEFPKLMSCSKDGIDHSACCSRRGVPDRCLFYCNRRLLTDVPPVELDSCSGYTSDIVTCVETGHRMVPPTPTNLHVKVINPHTLNVSWDPSDRDDGIVPMYVVYYKRQHDEHYSTNRTENAWLILPNVNMDVEYNLTVIAANHYGFSMFADLITVGLWSMEVSSGLNKGRSGVGTAIAVIFFLFIVSVIVMLAVYFVRRPQRFPDLLRKLRGNWGRPPSHTDGAVAFENPGYDKDPQVRVIQPANGANGNGTSADVAASTSGNGATWEQAELEPAPDGTVAQTQRGMRYTQFS